MPYPLSLRRPLAGAAAVALLGGAGLAAVHVAGADAKTKPLHLSAKSKSIAYNKVRLTATHGRISIVFNNPNGSIAPHAVAIEGHGVDKDGKIVTAGHKSTLTVTLKKGTYTFYCPVGNHRAQGMVGKLVVK